MNFNQPLPNNGNMSSQTDPSLQQQQQQQQPQRGVPVITHQLLASLNPQQLQQFKSHPQFQEIMRNYLQRQHALQMQGQGQPGQAPLQGQPGQPGLPQNFNNQGRPGEAGIPGAIGGQAPQRNLGPRAGMNSINQQGLQQGIPQGVQGLPQGIPGAGGFSPAVGAHPGNFQPNLQQQHPQQHPGIVPGGAPVPGIIPTAGSISPHKANMIPQPPHRLNQQGTPLTQNPIAPVQLPQDPNLPPQFPPEVLNSIPLPTLSKLNEWSEKLQKEGKEVPKDVELYESIIKKDQHFLSGFSKQINGNKALMERLAKDIAAYNHIKQLRMNAINISSKGQFNNSIWGEGYQGYGNGITNTATKLILPKRDWTDEQINERVLKNLEKPQNLVPIRLAFDLERDRFKLRDTFLWDLNEEVLSVESFVSQLIEDYKLIPKGHQETILASVKEQINDYQKKPIKPLGELRVPIKIDVTINNIQLTDQFEWDVLNFEDNDPEDFALVMCEELNLPGEFTTAIAHTIREQSQLYHKTLILVGYSFDGSPIQEDEIRSHLLPSLRLVAPDYSLVDDFFSILRNPNNVSDFTPALVKLSQLEVERLDKEIERESRRKRRHNTNELDLLPSTSRTTTSRRIALHAGRGGPSLPDLSDLPKTFRTPAPSSVLPGGVDLGVPDIYEYSEIFANKSQIRNPAYKPQPQPKDQVRLHHDPILGNLFVTIKMRRRA